MACKIEFSTDNDAFRFEDGTLNEEAVANELRKIADAVDKGVRKMFVMDANGNRVGSWSLD